MEKEAEHRRFILNLPGKTIERLSQYRRVLFDYMNEGKDFIYSHQLAALLHLTSVQVRRDLMLIGYSGSLRKGYNINELITCIGRIIDSKITEKLAVIGLGNIGKAIIRYLNGKGPKLLIVAGFDNDPEKVNRKNSGLFCYHIDQLKEIIQNEGISVAILTVPPDQAREIALKLVDAGIKGILNYTSAALNITSKVYVEEYDIITSVEKTVYFARKIAKQKKTI